MLGLRSRVLSHSLRERPARPRCSRASVRGIQSQLPSAAPLVPGALHRGSTAVVSLSGVPILVGHLSCQPFFRVVAAPAPSTCVRITPWIARALRACYSFIQSVRSQLVGALVALKKSSYEHRADLFFLPSRSRSFYSTWWRGWWLCLASMQ